MGGKGATCGPGAVGCRPMSYEVKRLYFIFVVQLEFNFLISYKKQYKTQKFYENSAGAFVFKFQKNIVRFILLFYF